MEKPAWKKEHRPTFHCDLTVSWYDPSASSIHPVIVNFFCENEKRRYEATKKKSDLLKRQMKF